MVLGIPWPGIDLPILGVVPVLFLMFFVKPTGQVSRPDRYTCSRCASPHASSQNFCTKCGWDLSQEYVPENSDTVLASEMHKPQASSTGVVDRPIEQPSPETAAAQNSSASEPSPVAEQATEIFEPVPEQPVSEAAPSQADSPVSVDEAPVVDPASDPEARPWGIPQPGPAPTAEVMTARGTALLTEGKLQEAIDQFTKAIALDPKHREAFERRAEAYSKQGRGERAEEDYQTIQALNAGS